MIWRNTNGLTPDEDEVIEIEEKTPMSRRQDLIEAVILVQKHLEILTDIVTFCGRKGVSWLRSDGILSITSDGFKKRPRSLAPRASCGQARSMTGLPRLFRGRQQSRAS